MYICRKECVCWGLFYHQIMLFQKVMVGEFDERLLHALDRNIMYNTARGE